MKPATLFLLLVLVFPGCIGYASAQGFRGGLKAGLSASEVSGDGSGGLNKLGLFASIFTDYKVSDRSFWHLELMYIQKGSREFNDPDPDDPMPSPYRDYTFTLQYIEIPVLFKIDFPIMGRLRHTQYLSGEIGISVSKVIGHAETNDFGVDITDLMAEDRPFHNAELNAILGIVVPLRANFAFSARLIQGISPLRDHASGKKTWYNQGQYNTAWALGLSYTIF